MANEQIPVPAATPSQSDQLETRRVPLSRAIQAHDQKVSELVIYEPTAKELQALERGKGEIARVNHLLAECARIPYSSVLLLRARDWQACMEALAEMGFSGPTEQQEPS
jgi:hypothetical protein